MSKEPIILLAPEEASSPFGTVFIMSDGYAGPIREAGGIPLGASDYRAVEAYAEFADALVLTGGPDIHPARYGQFFRDFKEVAGFSGTRDDLDFALFEKFLAGGKPVLGIGRGAQVVNVALGGTLKNIAQSKPKGSYVVSSDRSDVVPHRYGAHTVTVEKGSRLAAVLGERAVVNTFHHQAIDTLGDGLRAVAHSEDGVIEAVEHKNLPILGVQWHSEHEFEGCSPGNDIFKAFLDVVQEVRP